MINTEPPIRTAICPLCGQEALFEVSIDSRDFYRCGRCDLTFVPRDQHLPPDEEKARYSLHNNTIDNEGYVRMFTDKFPALKRYCVGMRTVLDYGCGPGPVLVELLNREGYQAVGYDPFFAPQTDLIGPYDGVISTETFEHFAYPYRELQRIRDMLCEGGYLAVMTRQRTADIDLENWWYVRDPTHVALYSPSTFDWIAENCGFRLLYQNREDFVVLQKR